MMDVAVASLVRWKLRQTEKLQWDWQLNDRGLAFPGQRTAGVGDE